MIAIRKPHTRDGPESELVSGDRPINQGLIKAKHLMTTPVIWVGPDATVQEVAKLLSLKKVSAVPVILNDEVVGMISHGDLIERQELGTETTIFGQRSRSANVNYNKVHGMQAGDVMSSDVFAVQEDASLTEIVEIMQAHQVRRVLVRHQNELVGIVSRSDIVQLLATRPAGSTGPAEGDDDVIRFRVIDVLVGIPGTSPWNTNVEVENGTVRLNGYVEQESSIKRSSIEIKKIPHVISVRDDRTILQPYWG